MTLLNLNLDGLILPIYFVLHIPAFILLIVGIANLKRKPNTAKTLLVIAGIYFLIGGGICASIFN
jgi:hypothetical protein